MKLVLEKSGSKEGERFYAALTFAENSNYNYIATRDHLIRQDKLIISSNIFNTSTVSFGENDIRRVDYHEWNRSSSRNRDKNSSFGNIGYNMDGKNRDSWIHSDNSRNDTRRDRQHQSSNSRDMRSNRDDDREVFYMFFSYHHNGHYM
jgi:hypothetical protein